MYELESSVDFVGDTKGKLTYEQVWKSRREQK